MRHGEAEQSTDIDSQRCLTSRGIAEAFDAGRRLNLECAKLDGAWVSEYRRARQTFDEVTTSVQCNNIKYSSRIIPSSRAEDVQRRLDSWLLSDNVTSALIVSHMPLVSYLVDLLCDNTGAVLFPTAAIAEIDYDPVLSSGHLVGFSAPD
jgi:phosphohistidine phosphatase